MVMVMFSRRKLRRNRNRSKMVDQVHANTFEGGVEFLQAIDMHGCLRCAQTLACAPVSLAVPQPSFAVSTALRRATRHFSGAIYSRRVESERAEPIGAADHEIVPFSAISACRVARCRAVETTQLG